MMDGISDVMIPTIFIKWIMSILNQQREGYIYSDEAFTSLKHFILRLFYYVSRHLIPQEKEQMKMLIMIPYYLGGLGNDA